MSRFARSPFAEQQAQIDLACDAKDSGKIASLLTEAASLADSGPLAYLVVRLVQNALLAPHEELLHALLEQLSGASLQSFVLGLENEPGTRPALQRWTRQALTRRPIRQLNSQVFLRRWMRLNHPAELERISAHAQKEWSPGGSFDERWLLFLSGQQLVDAAQDHTLAPIVQHAVHAAIDALAAAPKSISQSNAEALLAGSVYADPAHFFFELLQNADDAGATRWSAHFEPQRHTVVIEHDGQPLSLVDLVGIVSIGQTNKDGGQIGRFGAGFKSVYQVCERPRIHSGVFDFEIAQVSIPRRLSSPLGQKGETPAGATTRVELPLRTDIDAAVLMHRASQLPPEVLLTLASVRSLQVHSGADLRVGWTHRADGVMQTLTPDDGSPARRFLCAETKISRGDVAKKTHLSDLGRVLVMVELDDFGHPVFRGGPTLYAFLPTAQYTGLRFRVHARFDVTLDRERLAQDSLWNEALLSEAGRVVGTLIEQLVEREISPLPVLSAPDALGPMTASLTDSLTAALRGRPCLPAAVPPTRTSSAHLIGPRVSSAASTSGHWLRPSDAWIVPAPLVVSLAGVELGHGGFALARLNKREQAVALSLGAREFTTARLVTLLETLAAGTPRPSWLDGPVFEALEKADISESALRALALLEDGNGLLCRPADAFEAPASWATLYAGVRSVVDTHALLSLPSSLRERVRPEMLDEAVLIEDLTSAPWAATLRSRPEDLLAVLNNVADSTLAALDRIPLWRATSGERLPARDLRRCIAPLANEEAIANEIQKSYALLDPEHERQWTNLAQRCIPELTLDHIPGLISKHGWPDVAASALVSLLDRHVSSLTSALSMAFAAVPLFPDQHGSRRPLTGNERGLLAHAPSMCGILPEWPWLAQPLGSFIAQNTRGRVTAQDVAGALLAGAASHYPVIPENEAAYGRVLGWLGDFSGEFGRGLIEALCEAAIWPAVNGDRLALRALRLRGDTPHVERFYEVHASRPVASDAALNFAQALGVEQRVRRSDEAAVAFDLMRTPAELPLTELAPLLNGAAPMLSGSQLMQLCETPLFRDIHGQRCWLTRLSNALPGACFCPGDLRPLLETGSYPVLGEDDERMLAPFLRAAKIDTPTTPELIRQLSIDENLRKDRPRLQLSLRDRADSLTPHDRLALADLPLFENLQGKTGSIREFADVSVFQDQLTEQELEHLSLDAHCLTQDQASLAETLGLVPRSAAEILTTYILPTLAPQMSLHSVPQPWSSRTGLVRLLSLVETAGLQPENYALGLDQHERLCRPPLSSADAGTRRLLAELALPLDRQGDPDFGRARNRLLPGGSAAQATTASAHPSKVATLSESNLPFLERRPLADLEWSALVPDHMLSPINPGDIALALAAAYPRAAAPNPGRRFLEPDTLYAWLLAHRDELAANDASMHALGLAALFPAGDGTRKAARDLILDTHLPDLGLGWGVAPEVPEELVQWLHASFEFDRHRRRLVISNVLDALDDAAEQDHHERATELIAFLARTLDAVSSEPEALKTRVRQTKIRARLRVPLGGPPNPRLSWDKPRRCWLGTTEDAARVARFCLTPPPRCSLQLDAGMRALLLACGASAELPDEVVEACLAGHAAVPTVGARSQLAQYILEREEHNPGLRHRWSLDEHAWVPRSTTGGNTEFVLANSLVWPSPLAESLLGPESSLFPERSLLNSWPGADFAPVPRLGFRPLETLRLMELLPPPDMPASAGLLAWLEDGLQTGRLKAPDLKVLTSRLLLTDDNGQPRFARELAVTECRVLLGAWRGEFSDGHRYPRLRKALAIPFRPGSAMVLSLIAEVSAELKHQRFDRTQRRDLERRLPLWFEALSAWHEQGESFSLGKQTWVTALRQGQGQGQTELVPLAHFDVCLFEPSSFAAALPDGVVSRLAEVLPMHASPSLSALLIEAGARDLRTLFDAAAVHPGPDRPECQEAGVRLQQELEKGLGVRLKAKVRVVSPLSMSGRLRLEGHPSETFRVPADGVLLNGTLWLTPDAIDAPERLAVALEPDPLRRSRLRTWLAEGSWQNAPTALARANSEMEPKKDAGLFGRIRRFWGGQEEPSKTAESVQPKAERSRKPDGPLVQQNRDRELFAQATEISSQLRSAEAWLNRRTTRPEFGFRFEPKTLPAPWVYAPKFVSVDFEQRRQRWRPSRLKRPTAGDERGLMVFRGTLPAGLSVLPVPTFGTVLEVQVDGDAVHLPLPQDPTGGTLLRLKEAGDVRFRVRLGQMPDLQRALEAPRLDATRPLVPDDELPEEALDLVASLDRAAPPAKRALQIRDFIRSRYRYDPSYLEQPAVAQWLSRLTAGRRHRHIAALHAAADDRHLGAGVCYELNALACELIRRAGIPAAVATGWVLDGGGLSEADHLWCIALLQDHDGQPLWLPIDASTTESGRPLRVRRRPPGRFRAPRDRRAQPPKEPEAFRSSTQGSAPRTSRGQMQKKVKRDRAKRTHIPRAEMLRLLVFLERLAGRELSERERRKFESALSDPAVAKALLDSLS